MIELAFFAAGAGLAGLVAVAILVLGLQALTGFPFRTGWRKYSGPIGKVLPEDKRLLPRR